MPDGLARLWSPYGQDLCRQQGTYAIVESIGTPGATTL
jgi:hypothetical protein